jgi:hypothetical protein
MALLVESQVRAAARAAAQREFASTESLLQESRKVARTSHDIFLSHSKLDSELILGVKMTLESTGRSVYVDWIDDPQLDRSKVSPATAQALRKRMAQSNALFYVHSLNATASRWMPWELGYFDGLKGNVAILPVVASSYSEYKGEEYLGLYPHVDLVGSSIFINDDRANFKNFADWLVSSNKMRPSASV